MTGLWLRLMAEQRLVRLMAELKTGLMKGTKLQPGLENLVLELELGRLA